MINNKIKALIFSDSHGDFHLLDEACIHFNMSDRIFGLGDYDSDFFSISLRNITGVRGNSFMDPDDLPYDNIVNLGGFKVLFTHGHTHSVRDTRNTLLSFAKRNNIDVCFYGHTHKAMIEEMEGIYFINPGSITLPHYPDYPTLIYMIIDNGSMNIDIISAKNYKTFDSIIIKK